VKSRIAVIACVAVLAVPSFSRAEKGVPWAAGSIGFHTYAMGDVNDGIHGYNTLIAPLNMEDIKSGLGLGGAVGMDYPKFSVAVSYERLKGKSDVSDVSGHVEYRVPANLFLAEGTYRRPTSGSLGWGIGAGIGLVSSAAEVDATIPALTDQTRKLEGSSAAFDVFVTGVADVYKHVAVVPSVGYRYAKIGEVKSDGATLTNSDGSKFTLDYSGLMTKVMVRFTL
jgi:hypothetical protein